MSQRQLPAQLRKLPSSRKGKKLTPAELRAKKTRVELSLKQSVQLLMRPKGKGLSLIVWKEH